MGGAFLIPLFAVIEGFAVGPFAIPLFAVAAPPPMSLLVPATGAMGNSGGGGGAGAERPVIVASKPSGWGAGLKGIAPAFFMGFFGGAPPFEPPVILPIILPAIGPPYLRSTGQDS
jgi:hypothetical protein